MASASCSRPCAIDGAHGERMDDVDLGAREPAAQVVLAVVVHQEAGRAAVHAVDRHAVVAGAGAASAASARRRRAPRWRRPSWGRRCRRRLASRSSAARASGTSLATKAIFSNFLRYALSCEAVRVRPLPRTDVDRGLTPMPEARSVGRKRQARSDLLHLSVRRRGGADRRRAGGPRACRLCQHLPRHDVHLHLGGQARARTARRRCSSRRAPRWPTR